MARPYRLEAEDTLYHIISRGNDHKRIYLADSDYLKYLSYLENAKKKFGFYLYSYVLMTNHVHLQIETAQANISRIMQYINSSYTTYFNLKHRKSGHLFQGRYKSIVVDKDAYLMELTRYIHLNPVHANMVKDPIEYRWSSYREYINKIKQGIVSREKLREYMDWNPVEYQTYIAMGMETKLEFKDKIYGGFILGKERFIKNVLNNIKGKIEEGEVAYAKKIRSPYSIDEVLQWFCKKRGIKEDLICQAKNKRSEYKKESIYLLKRLTGYTNEEIGKRFGMSFSAVSKAAKSFENKIYENERKKKKLESLISSFKV